jgi:hypothetical protein
MEPESSLPLSQEPACVKFRKKMEFTVSNLALSQPQILRTTYCRLLATVYSIYS